jgi:hypothetical protein
MRTDVPFLPPNKVDSASDLSIRLLRVVNYASLSTFLVSCVGVG